MAHEAHEGDRPAVFQVSRKEGGWRFSRRAFIMTAGAAAAGATFACGGASEQESWPTWTPEPTATAAPTWTPSPTTTPLPTATPVQPPDAESELATARLGICAAGLAHGGHITGLVITPDGRLLYSTDRNGEMKAWALPFGARMMSARPHEGAVTGLVMSPDGASLCTCSEDNSLITWSLPDLFRLADLDLGDFFTYGILGMAVSPSFDRVVAGGEYGYTGIFSLPDGQLINQFWAGYKPFFALSPDGMTLVADDFGGDLVFYTLPSGDEMARLPLNQEITAKPLFSADGGRIFVGGERAIAIVDSASRVLLTEREQGAPVTAMALSPDGTLLATSRGGAVNLWSAPGITYLRTLDRHADSDITALAFTPDNRWLVSATWGGLIHLWSVETGRFETCLVDIDEMGVESRLVQYETYSDGQAVTITLPEGADIPGGAACTCNTVAGTDCDCVGYSSSGGGSHYWFPN